MFTEKLASFAAGLSFENINQNVVEKTKDCLIDYLRLAILGSSYSWSKKMVKIVRNWGGAEEATVIQGGIKLPSPNAAFLNGTFSHSLEWDDIHLQSITHPGAVIFSSALSIGEYIKTDGRTFLAAVVLGYEIMIRIGLSVQLSHYVDKGFHGTATLGVFGSACTAAKLLGYDYNKMLHSIGIASSYSSGLARFHLVGGSVKRIHGGKAAQEGIWAALLAGEGITNSPAILEAKRMGYCQAYSDKCDFNKPLERLGEDFKIMEVAIKTHACGRGLQASIDAVAHLAYEYGISADEVKKIEIEGSKVHAELCNRTPDLMGAQLSIPFSIALLLIRGNYMESLTVDDYINYIKNTKVLNLAKRIHVVLSEKSREAIAANKYPAEVEATLETNDGRKISKVISHPKGDPENPISSKELRERFKKQTKNLISISKAQRIIELVDQLEKINNISELCDILL